MFRDYVIKWQSELCFALVVFVVYMLSAFVATGDVPVDSWSDWIKVTAAAGARVASVALLKPLTAWVAQRGSP